MTITYARTFFKTWRNGSFKILNYILNGRSWHLRCKNISHFRLVLNNILDGRLWLFPLFPIHKHFSKRGKCAIIYWYCSWDTEKTVPICLSCTNEIIFETPAGVLGFIWGGMFVSSSCSRSCSFVLKWRAKYWTDWAEIFTEDSSSSHHFQLSCRARFVQSLLSSTVKARI